LGDLVGHPGERTAVQQAARAGAPDDVPDAVGEVGGQVVVIEIAHADTLRSGRRVTARVVGVRHHEFMSVALDRFHPATVSWFRGAFGEHTAAQSGAWAALAGG